MRNLNICKGCPYCQRKKKLSSDRVTMRCTWMDKIPHRPEVFKHLSLAEKKEVPMPGQWGTNTEQRKCLFADLQEGGLRKIRSRLSVCQRCEHFSWSEDMNPRYKCSLRFHVNGHDDEWYAHKDKFEVRIAPEQCPYTLELLVLQQEKEKKA